MPTCHGGELVIVRHSSKWVKSIQTMHVSSLWSRFKKKVLENGSNKWVKSVRFCVAYGQAKHVQVSGPDSRRKF